MYKPKRFFRKLFSPITIILAPHSKKSPFSIKLPFVGIIFFFVLWVFFTSYILSLGITAKKYYEIKDKLNFYHGQFIDLRLTINSLKEAETQFKRIFALNDKDKILETLDVSDSGSLDIEVLKEQIERTMETVGEIKDYLRQERDIYLATPSGSPVEEGYVNSPFGWRTHPINERKEFHNGVDIAARPGTLVRATADGIVSFAGWNGGSGKVVVIEHGFGFTTCYAHNRKIIARVGQLIHRDDVIAYVGSTGSTTGPHVHYEVWIDKKPINPKNFLVSKRSV